MSEMKMWYAGCMKQYEAKTYTLPKIEGISEKALEVHLGLYKGYVNNLNAHYEKLCELQKNEPDNALVISALMRRIGFELAGIQNHERYFEMLEGGPAPCTEGSELYTFITKQAGGSFDMFKEHIKQTALMMRGIGWVLIVYDKEKQMLHGLWVADHELGNVNLPVLLAIDMWEHAYMVDYPPAEKEKYVSAYLDAINWPTAEKRFSIF